LSRAPSVGDRGRAAAEQHGQNGAERDKSGGSKAAAAGPPVLAGDADIKRAQVPQGYDNAPSKDAADPDFFLSVS
jgi:hypothetical protein